VFYAAAIFLGLAIGVNYMTDFRKTIGATSLAAALVGLSGPANALIEAAPGEALLVPFVLYDSGQIDPVFVPTINTLVQVTVPAQVGFDTIPAFFTASHSSPTNFNSSFSPDEPALGETGDFTAGVHLYVFDQRSVEIYNTEIPTSPDDLITINWGDYVTNNAPSLDGVKGYMVITNEKTDPTYYPFGWLDDARFSMFGDAYLVWNLPGTGIGLIDTKIPVLPMNDGANSFGDVPSVNDNVIFNSDGSIVAVSPLFSGMRTNRSNNQPGEFTLFDLTMSNRFAPTLHVIWVDQNIRQTVTQFVFDDDEQDCSQPIPITNELNVYWTSPALLHPNTRLTRAPAGDILDGGSLLTGVSLPWVDAAVELCYPDRGALVFNPGVPGQLFDVLESNILYPGFVRFRINEYIDTNIGEPESSAVAFSIQLQLDILDEQGDLLFAPQLLPVETALGHERGQFSPF
jgi:hypothetical protein